MIEYDFFHSFDNVFNALSSLIKKLFLAFFLTTSIHLLYSVDGDTLQATSTEEQNGWTIYLVSILIMAILFFVQKYAYLIDRKLNRIIGSDYNWEGSPWPLFAGLILGVYTLLYNVFSPENMHINPNNWQIAEWILVIAFTILFILLAVESLSHFGIRFGIIRLVIKGTLVIGFYFSGLLVGLLLVALIAIIVLIYFIKFWRKKMIIN